MFHYLKYFLFHGIGLLAATAMFLGDGWITYGLAIIFGGYILLDAILGDDVSTPTFKHPQILTVQLWLALPLLSLITLPLSGRSAQATFWAWGRPFSL